MMTQSAHNVKINQNLRILLIGNPNSGKSTLFNALTGKQQKVGNWAGVTLEQYTAKFVSQGITVSITDLPGLYALNQKERDHEVFKITTEAVIKADYDLIFNVLDASHLEQDFFLSSQLLELGKPLILILNKMDLAAKQGIKINLPLLSSHVHAPVIALQANYPLGIDKLLDILKKLPKSPVPLSLDLPPKILALRQSLVQKYHEDSNSSRYAFYLANRKLEDFNANIEVESEETVDVWVANARYSAIHEFVLAVQSKTSDFKEKMTHRLDAFFLNRYFALPIFFAMMYLVFFFAVRMGGLFQDFFDILSETLFVQGTRTLLLFFQAPSWLTVMMASGLGKGINTTMTFIPVIACMFFSLSFLEASGYMARAAFVADKFLRFFGLPGKAFVPMIIGFGCNVPGIISARILDSKRDKILTVLMIPFMSCSARLAIYSAFVAVFFPKYGQNIVFSLYLIGILMAVLTGFFLQKILALSKPTPLLIDLPAYQWPSWSNIFKETGFRLFFFLKRAAFLIIPVSICLSALNAIDLKGHQIRQDHYSDSIIADIGKTLTPLFAPMGIHQDNWQATVGLCTGILAKEVVIGTLNNLYLSSEKSVPFKEGDFNLAHALNEGFLKTKENIEFLGSSLMHPMQRNPVSSTEFSVIHQAIQEKFDGKIGAYAYLLFILLYTPCISTIAAIRQEANTKLMWFSMIWSNLIAYWTAVLFYQIAKFQQNPLQTMIWILSALFFAFAFKKILKRYLLGEKIDLNFKTEPGVC